MRGGVTRVTIAAIACLVAACGQAARTYYDDLEGGANGDGSGSSGGGGDVTVPGNDAGEDAREDAPGVDGSSGGQDAPAGDGALVDGPDATGDAGDGSAADSGRDAGDGGDGGDGGGGCGPLNTPTNCGACGASCDTAHSTGAGCSAGACTYTGCQFGFKDCDMATAPADFNGCETQTNTPAACGGCAACAAFAGSTASTASASCVAVDAGAGNTCRYTCNSGYADCNAQTAPDTDGCETQTNTTANCGGCGITCGTLNATAIGCNGSACTYTCTGGHSNCNTTGSNTTGCECATPGCCGSGASASCQKTHNNGIGLSALGYGQSWYDCTALGTYNLTQATAACVAWKGAGQCSSGWTCGPNGSKVAQAVVCDNACTTCWAYGTAGGSYPTTAGTVTDCNCPGALLGGAGVTTWQ